MFNTSNFLPLRERAWLSSLYNEKHRHYHDIRHIYNLCSEYETFKNEAMKDQVTGQYEYDQIVYLSIWYHDCVYNPYAQPGSNESESATLFMGQHHNNLEYSLIVHNIIESTADHVTTNDNLSVYAQLVLDLDLTGLGKPWRIYKQNSDEIRKEYYTTTDDEFIDGRLKWLKMLISNRESLYYTDYFRTKYQEEAMYNIKTEISRLECGSL